MKSMYQLGKELGEANTHAANVLEREIDAVGEGFRAVVRIKRAYVSYLKLSFKESLSIENNLSFLKECIKTGPSEAMKDILRGAFESTLKGMRKEVDNG
ncbi:MAG: hypothetical protein E6R04_09360 [Spirochaetes bacterium]|nr:MAG: hypothetical protein E6R04_09360 [Spirochaetota bacterium]